MMEVFCFQLIASLIITKSSALSGILDRSGTPDELYSLLVSAIWDSLWDMLWPMRYATSYQLFVSIDMFYHISYGQSYELWVVYSVCMICHMRCNMSYIAIWGNISTGDPIQLPNKGCQKRICFHQNKILIKVRLALQEWFNLILIHGMA